MGDRGVVQGDPAVMAALSRIGQVAHQPYEGDVVAAGRGRAYLRFTWQGPVPERVWLVYRDGAWRRTPAVAVSGGGDRWVFRAAVEVRRPVFAYRLEAQWVEAQNGGRAVHAFAGPRSPAGRTPEEAGLWQVDLGALRPFAVPRWVARSVMYQIFPDRFYNGDPTNDPEGVVPWGSEPTFTNFFGGDLVGIARRLDYLADLGVGAVYLNPIVQAPSNHRYDASDYLKVDPALGTEEDVRRLADALHRRGMRLILDAVFNHTGETHWAFQDVVRRGPESPYFDWYFVHSWPITRTPPSYACWWGLAHLPKLNTSNPAVREHLFEVTRYWMNLGADGWRLDVPNELEGDFWQQWRKLVKSIRPDAYIVGEIWHDALEWLRGDQFDGVMNYVLRDALLDFFVRRAHSGARLAAILADQAARYPAPAVFSLMNLLGSHDTERIRTAAGDRRAVMAMFLWVMAYPGMPCLYYGDEVGMTGGRDPECRRGFPWSEADQDVALWRWVRRLIRLRRRLPVLTDGDLAWVEVRGSEDVAAFGRMLPGAAGPGAFAICVVSRSPEAQAVTLEASPGFGCPAGGRERAPVQWVDVLSRRVVASGRRPSVRLEPWGVALLVSAEDRRQARLLAALED